MGVLMVSDLGNRDLGGNGTLGTESHKMGESEHKGVGCTLRERRLRQRHAAAGARDARGHLVSGRRFRAARGDKYHFLRDS